MRQEILQILSGKRIDAQPAFSGLIHVSAEGLEREQLILHEVHKDAHKMARAAASTFKLSGMPSAALPLDLCAPAEALGAELNFYEAGEFQFPQVRRALFETVKDITPAHTRILQAGRLQIICEAIGLLKNDIGSEVVISGMIPGPYTLLLYLCNPRNLFIEMKKEPQAVAEALLQLASLLAEIGRNYRMAGADFITIHDMGGSAGFIGPAKYEQFVLPAEKLLIEQLPKPRVLSICGNVTSSLHLLFETGADAISIDQTTDLAAARLALKDTLLFGNVDPVATLYQGDQAQVRDSAKGAACGRGCGLARL